MGIRYRVGRYLYAFSYPSGNGELGIKGYPDAVGLSGQNGLSGAFPLQTTTSTIGWINYQGSISRVGEGEIEQGRVAHGNSTQILTGAFPGYLGGLGGITAYKGMKYNT